MIIGSDQCLAVGERHVGLTDTDAAPHAAMPFVVVRVATAAEWLREAAADGMPLSAAQRAHAARPDVFFYDVSVD